MNLNGQKINLTYTGLLNIGSTGADASYKQVTDGDGTNVGVQLSTAGTKLDKANIFMSNVPGPYADDADFYSNYSGGTAGQLYLLTSGSKVVLTIAGNN